MSRDPDDRRLALSGLVATVVLAFACRVWPQLSAVFRPGHISLYGDGDVYYHVRRIQLAAAHWPWLDDFDGWMAYPDGAYAIWSPLFDWIPATLSVLTGIDPTVVAIFWPPLLGAACCIPLFFILRRVMDSTRLALSGLVVFAVLPGALMAGPLGRVDHHVAEVLLQLGAYGLLLAHLERIEAGGRVGRSAMLLGAWMGVAMLTWAGSPLFLCVIAITVGARALQPTAGSAASPLLRYNGLAFAFAGLVALSFGIVNGTRGREPLSPNFLSLLQPVLCLLLAVAPWVLCWTCRPWLEGARAPSLRRFALVAGSLALVGTLTPLGAGVLNGLKFLTRQQDPWLASIAEFTPMFQQWTYTQATIGFGIVVVPLGVLGLLWRAGGVRQLSAAQLFAVVWLLHAGILATLQIRFIFYVAPVVAALPALAWWLARPAGVRPGWIAASAALATLAPALLYWAPLFGGQPLAYPQMRPELLGFLSAIRDHTPAAGDIRDPRAKPAYGIMAPWDMGHWLVTVSERAVVANNFGAHLSGGGYQDSEQVFERLTEAGPVESMLERRRCRYLLTSARSDADTTAAPLFATRLHSHDGSDTRAGEGSGRLRLALQSPGRIHGSAMYKLFEVVPGATLELPVDEGEHEVRTTVASPARSFEYVRGVTPTGAGRGRVRVSYPGLYEVRRDGEVIGQIPVSDAAVAGGHTLR